MDANNTKHFYHHRSRNNQQSVLTKNNHVNHLRREPRMDAYKEQDNLTTTTFTP
ncbi:uncharacterized protein CELE_H43I07.4 [Caenorhabditis elegans]|uniref:Uncharacterized protein n=1 Tax=Caenorhabditis elegans TaxID=6239 RepID=A0A164D3I7_CAEEL|nr:Uncharacterized protein CELE_H43I07.4 [Caenorhabditis elegans]SAP35591.1 Uncharacterized protein CELE_H43I07.4 [Caenorhabditis elegans]|eukprot:NP_001317829.1 Uncharacterized protein CELE_H43I07.4 [Caenorhabditis elegans]